MFTAGGELDAGPGLRLVRLTDLVRARARDYAQLAKARLSLMVLLAAIVGYWLAASAIDLSHFLWFTLGTFLVVGGANAFNQVLERDSDRLMTRTARRPLPAGRVGLAEAVLVSGALSATGVGILLLKSGRLPGTLAVVALAIYVLIYTPLKTRSAWSTVPGAVAGAIPPLMGGAAARGELSPLAWCLFGILFLWQFPHTWAIAAAYREDYRRVGHRGLPDRGTRVMMAVMTAALVAASLLPSYLDLARAPYALAALVLGGLILAAAFRFGNGSNRSRAGALLGATLLYLPLLLLTLVAFGPR